MKTSSPLMPQLQWKLLQVHFEWIGLSTTEKNMQLHRDTPSPYWVAGWVHKGKISARASRYHAEARAGEWIFRQPARTKVDMSPDSIVLWIAFSVHWQGEGRMLFPPKKILWKTEPQPAMETKALRLLHAVEHHDPTGVVNFYSQTRPISMFAHLDYQHLFYDWLKSWETVQREHGMGWYYARNIDEKVAASIRYMEELPTDQGIRLAEIASSFGISVGHLIYLFQKQFGMPPKAYRMRLQLQRAMQELQTTSDEVKEIAHRFGFTPAWFGAWIKRETGKTPMQLRREAHLTSQRKG